jgi:hypothetical protein
MAFISFLSGRFEVYVQPIDRSTDAVPVSTRGGTGPVWSRSGDRLFFRQGRLLMAAPIVSRPRLEVGTPEVVFDGGWELAQDTTTSYVTVNYDALPDGRFLMVRSDPAALQTRINVIFNWFEELNRLVPLER